MWKELLNTHFDIDEGNIWTAEIIDNLFSKISITESNKKIFELIKSSYNKQWINQKGDTDFEKEFKKPEI